MASAPATGLPYFEFYYFVNIWGELDLKSLINAILHVIHGASVLVSRPNQSSHKNLRSFHSKISYLHISDISVKNVRASRRY